MCAYSANKLFHRFYITELDILSYTIIIYFDIISSEIIPIVVPSFFVINYAI